MQQNVRSIRASYTKQESRVIDLGLLDARGRRIGMLVTIGVTTFASVQAPMPASCYPSVLEPGAYGTVEMMVTRNGRPFGASQSQQYFARPDMLQNAITARLKVTRTRYAKQKGVTAAPAVSAD